MRLLPLCRRFIHQPGDECAERDVVAGPRFAVAPRFERGVCVAWNGDESAAFAGLAWFHGVDSIGTVNTVSTGNREESSRGLRRLAVGGDGGAKTPQRLAKF